MDLRRRLVAAVSVAALVGLSLAAPAPAAQGPQVARQADDSYEPGPTLLLVDLSGSMGDRDDNGRVKIAGARAGLNGYLAALPDGSTVGLRTYPEGDCGAGQSVIPISTLDRGAMGAEIRGLTNTEGGTPTAAALEAAGEDVEGYTNATIVLVSDGQSNCDADPCEVARELGAAGIDVTVNTVGFQIDGGGRTELECIAEATSGTYFDAEDSDALAEQLDALTRPRLSLTVDHPDSVAVASAGPDGRTIAVTATVRSAGSRPARDVQLTFRPRLDSDAPDNVTALSVGRPRVRVGNIEPGGSRSYTWSFNPPVDNVDWTIPFTVTALADNTLEPQTYDGEVLVLGAFGLGDAGPLLQDRDHVVIMGDSFSSGEGAGSYSAESKGDPNQCHRSSLTYATSLFDPKPAVIACSGATTADLAIDRPAKREPAQLDSLRDLANSANPADLVLITIGGNDIGFADIIKNCLQPGDCHRTGTISQCAANNSACIRVPLTQVITARLSGLAPTLKATYVAINEKLNNRQAVERRGSKAPIVVLAYPAITTDVLAHQGPCLGQTITLSAGEQVFGRDLVRRLNRVIGQAVDQARGAGVPIHFATDVEQAMLPDHTLCNDQAFVNPVQTGSGRIVAESFHPSGDGYRAMTAALVRWSNREDPGPASTLPGPAVALTSSGSSRARIAVGTDRTATVEAGGTYELTGDGFAPGTSVVAVLASDPRALGSAVAGPDGTVAVVAVVPGDAPIGNHTLRLEGLNVDNELIAASTDATVDRPRPAGIWALALVAIAAMAAAIVIGLMARRPSPGRLV